MSVKSVLLHLLHHGFPKDEVTRDRLINELNQGAPADKPSVSVVKDKDKP